MSQEKKTQKEFSNSYQYQKYWAQKNGFRNPRQIRLDRGIDVIKDQWRVKTEYTECDPTAVPIPFAPNYFITPMGVIWCFSERRGLWLIISQQSHKSGYKAFQPYINGKRYVKYVHRAVCSAFYGDRDANYEAHHEDGDKHNNILANLEWLPKAEHRSLRAGMKYRKG